MDGRALLLGHPRPRAAGAWGGTFPQAEPRCFFLQIPLPAVGGRASPSPIEIGRTGTPREKKREREEGERSRVTRRTRLILSLRYVSGDGEVRRGRVGLVV